MNSLQMEILNIFRAVKCVLEKNKIDYFAIGGTCIGAVRHGGFIPWDDDLDIAVPIEQFDYMIDTLKKELPQPFKIYTCQEHKHYRYIFIKVINTETTFIEKSEFEYPDAYKGVYIDIMPLGGVKLNKLFFWKVRKYWALNVYKRVLDFSGNTMRRIAIFLIHRLPFSCQFYSKKYMNFLKKYRFSDSEHIGYVWSPHIKKLFFDKAWFETFAEIPFEDTKIRCPINYDAYLTKQFGSYMTLPPKEEQVAHHFALIKLDIPFEYYVNNPTKVEEDYNNAQ